jgi:hypothetical protein
MAAKLAQSLGYHRANAGVDDAKERRERSWVFWAIYTLDKGLSLRLGRAPNLQDYDLSLAIPEIDWNSDMVVFECFKKFWALTASVQGRIYEHLYSPTAMSSTPEERAQKALRLGEEMESVMYQYSQVRNDTSIRRSN